MSDPKYRWTTTIRWVVDFRTNSAECLVDMDGEAVQVVVRSYCETPERAGSVAAEFCYDLHDEVREFILRRLEGMDVAKG